MTKTWRIVRSCGQDLSQILHQRRRMTRQSYGESAHDIAPASRVRGVMTLPLLVQLTLEILVYPRRLFRGRAHGEDDHESYTGVGGSLEDAMRRAEETCRDMVA